MTQDTDPVGGSSHETAARTWWPGLESLSRVIMSFGITGMLFFIVLVTRSNMNAIFDDFGVDLPPLTDFARSPLFACLAGMLFGLTVLSELLLKNKNVKAVTSNLSYLVALLLLGIYAVGMFKPLLILPMNLSK